MKNTFKKLFISFTVLSLTACGSTTMQDNTFAAKENKDFTKYTNQLVVEYAENDYTTMHQFFEHPEDYGIDVNKVDISLGEFYTDNTKEIKEDQKELKKFNRSTLDKTQQTIYDELKYENELSLKTENKKFQYSTIKKGSTAARFAGSLQWIEDVGITVRCNNLSITELPLDGNSIEDKFKIYMADTGLFVSMLEDGTQFDILNGNLFGYKGAIFENLVADVFSKMDRRLYYFKKDSGLELDFVIRYRGKCVPVEVKARDGNAKSVKTVLEHPEKYRVDSAIKLSDLNIGRTGTILTLPLYMAFLLTER